MNTLIIGDIHGCYDELRELLDKAGLSSDDQIIAVGDLVNRGPNSAAVLDFFRQQPNTRSIRGNHEYGHIRAHRTQSPKPKLSTLLTRWQLGADYDNAVAYMESLPIYLDLPDALLVHAYMEPRIPLDEQEDRMLMGTGGATGDLQEMYKKPWYTYYDGDKPVIVGHKDMSGAQEPFVYKDRVYGIDTGCVYGGQLTGLLLPEFRFISVLAREPYWLNTLLEYQELS